VVYSSIPAAYRRVIQEMLQEAVRASKQGRGETRGGMGKVGLAGQRNTCRQDIYEDKNSVKCGERGRGWAGKRGAAEKKEGRKRDAYVSHCNTRRTKTKCWKG